MPAGASLTTVGHFYTTYVAYILRLHQHSDAKHSDAK